MNVLNIADLNSPLNELSQSGNANFMSLAKLESTPGISLNLFSRRVKTSPTKVTLVQRGSTGNLISFSDFARSWT